MKQTYYYAVDQILSQYEHDVDAQDAPAITEKYFYIHDRLGSVRQVIDSSAVIQNSYTYSPFGEAFSGECVANADSPFMFTGQWFDDEIQQYYLRARMYDPALMLFTSRDPVKGKSKEPLTLHKYLYCWNDSINYTDPAGEYALQAVVAAIDNYNTGMDIMITGIEMDNDLIFDIGTIVTAATSLVYAVALATGGIVDHFEYGFDDLLCFTAETEVLAFAGEKPISEIKIGDMVWACDFASGETVLKPVIRTFQRQANEIYTVTVAGEEIETTSEHPFFVKGEGWIKASELQVGDFLVTFIGDSLEIENIEIICSPEMVYNFEIDDLHNYYVASNHVLVHNYCGEGANTVWGKGSYKSGAHSFKDHYHRHGKGMTEAQYLNKALNFRKKGARGGKLRSDGTRKYTRKDGEFIIYDRDGQIVSYGYNK